MAIWTTYSSSFFSPPSDHSDLLRSLLRLSREISLPDDPKPFPRRHFCSVSRRSKLFTVLFEELLRDGVASGELPSSATLCFREIFFVLNRLKSLLADCSNRSRTRLLLQADLVAGDLHEISIDLATLLDILPVRDLGVGDDVVDLVDLARRQCRRSSAVIDPAEQALRSEILGLIREIEREIVPERSRLQSIFVRLGLDDSRSCGNEIERLESEIGEKAAEKWTAEMIALVGLVRYAKCVLFGESMPRGAESSDGKFNSSGADPAAPPDFRCPISLDLMRDPVVVASGQTYDRESITQWLRSGHATCPKSGQTLTHLDVVPNKALRNLILLWCRENNVQLEGSDPGEDETNAVNENKAALEAARMTASFLVEKLAASPSTEATNRVVHELRLLAKSGSNNRAFVAEAGAVPLLIPLLYSTDLSLQLNAVTALLNLSILEANKRRIMHADGGLDAVLHVMGESATWQARENAAAAVLSLSAVHSYRRKLGRDPRVVQRLVAMVRSGPASAKKDALAAILVLAAERENISRLVEEGVVTAAMGSLEVVAEAAAVVAAVAKRGGAEAVAAEEGAVTRLVGVMRRGSEAARESAAAALVVICRRVGGAAVAGLAAAPGIEWVIWELMGTGTDRARRKAAALGRICRRWAAAVEADRTARVSALSIAAATAVS
ncbi:U-box domain-containing protein 16-like [Typha angustifolia]|uniref:U-box domain-containing protein 16-like n=1 Tax=Typha angustifolia TaxID=59011 RepID=UPI003C2EF26A